MPLPDAAQVVQELPPAVRPALAPLVKNAMGIAVAIVLATALLLLALFHAVLDPAETAMNPVWVWLIGNNFFPGYTPTVPGAFIGLLWGLPTGFVLGWLFALGRNKLVALWIFYTGARERLRANQDVLDNLM